MIVPALMLVPAPTVTPFTLDMGWNLLVLVTCTAVGAGIMEWMFGDG